MTALEGQEETTSRLHIFHVHQLPPSPFRIHTLSIPRRQDSLSTLCSFMDQPMASRDSILLEHRRASAVVEYSTAGTGRGGGRGDLDLIAKLFFEL